MIFKKFWLTAKIGINYYLCINKLVQVLLNLNSWYSKVFVRDC